MMNLLRRIARLFRQKIHALLQRAEDPVEALELLDAEYLDDLRKLRKHLIAVAAAEKRLELEVLRLREDEPCPNAYLMEVERGYLRVCAQRKDLEAIADGMRARLEALRVQRQTARAESIAARALIAAREWTREESLARAHEALLALRCRGQALAELNPNG
jgi:phage shock protein A